MYCLSLQRNSFGFLHLFSIRFRLYPVAYGNSLNHTSVTIMSSICWVLTERLIVLKPKSSLQISFIFHVSKVCFSMVTWNSPLSRSTV